MEKRNKIPITVQIVLEKGEDILLMKRKNTGYADGQYCLPGGHVEANEEIRKALAREAKEEIGITIKSQDMEFYKVLNRKVNEQQEYIDFIFKAKKWTGKIQNIEKEKCEEIKWINKNKLPANILDFIPKILKDSESIYMSHNWKEE